MKRLISLILLVCCPAVLVAAEAVVITPGQTVIVQTSAGPATGVVLPAADGQSYLVLSLSVPGGNLAVPYVIAPYGAVPTPGPGPSPGPGPGPSPVPVPGAKLWVLVVTETKYQTPEQAAVLGSKAVQDYIAAKGWQWRVIDQDVKDENGQPPADMAKWLDRAKQWQAKGNKLPYLNLADAQGVTAWEGALPATEAAMLEQLKKLGGP